jgi:hypothetical protein
MRTKPRNLATVLILAVAAVGAAAAPAFAIPPDPPPKPCERPNPPPICTAGSPKGTLTEARREPAGLVVAGTATDPDAPGAVTVSITVDDVPVGSLAASGPGGAFAGTLTPRAGQTVCAVAVDRNKGMDKSLGCRAVAVQVDPIGHVDEVRAVAGGIRVQGWAIDPDTTAPVRVRLTVDGAVVQEITASAARPDVAAAHPLYGAMHGFDMLLPGGSTSIRRTTRPCSC